nr:MAG TPA: ECF sigma factor [Caudoviricetes sp.]
MYGTLKALKSVITPELRQSTPEELCLAYQATKDGCYIAAMYEKMISVAMPIRNNYKIMDDELCASIMLEGLDTLMTMYDPKQKTKFKTLFYTSFSRMMYGWSKPYTRQKRTCPGQLVSIYDNRYDGGAGMDDDQVQWSNFIEDPKSTDAFAASDIHQFIDSDLFDKEQQKIISLLIEGYSISNITEILGIAGSRVHKQIKYIRETFTQNGITPKTVHKNSTSSKRKSSKKSKDEIKEDVAV